MSRMPGLAGRVALRVTGAFPEDFLSALAERNVGFRRLQREDELTIQLEVLAGDMPLVRRCAKKTMCGVEVLRVSGLVPFLRAAGPRLIYPAVLALLTGLVFWLQGHIWFFTVSGNQTVPAERILRALENQGVGFFTRAEDIDVNDLKNRVLAELPELGWITVNTQGGMAEVVVREREEKPVISRSAAPANITARKGGLITSVDAVSGTARVKRGDMVEPGELLISGVTVLDKTTLLTRAEGEVYARTWNRVSAVLPENAAKKVYTGRETARWSLTVGKKTINFYKSSRISYQEYDKIIENTVLSLPGGYTFPVAVTRLTLREYVPAAAETGEEAAAALLEAAVTSQLQREIAGTILIRRLESWQTAVGWTLGGTVECREEIGGISEIME